MQLPNAIRIILLVLSAISFIPQYHRVIWRRDSSGISPIYLILNLVAATQQFAFELYGIVFHTHKDLSFSPITTGDWLNLAQFAVVMAGHLSLLVAFLHFAPSRPVVKPVVFLVFLAFSFFFFEPIASLAREPRSDFDSWGHTFYYLAMAGVFSPLAELFIYVAYFFQARELRSRSDIGSVSSFGFILQAGVFLLVGIAWGFRFPHRYDPDRTSPIGAWYAEGGFALVDNLSFAVTQLILWWFARRLTQETPAIDGETTPLLG